MVAMRKKIGGKWYEFWSGYANKRDAFAEARKIKAKGYYKRVKTLRQSGLGGGMYLIYVRRRE